MNKLSKSAGLESRLKRFAGKAALVGSLVSLVGAGTVSAACIPYKTVTETVTTTVTQTITIPPYHTEEQLKSRLEYFFGLVEGKSLLESAVVTDSHDYRHELDELAEGLYYYVTGHTVEQDGFRLVGLTNDEYHAELLRLGSYWYDNLSGSAGFTGLTTDGLMNVYARTDQQILGYVFARFHELGIGRARMLPNDPPGWSAIYFESAGFTFDTVLRDLLDNFNITQVRMANTEQTKKDISNRLNFSKNNIDLSAEIPFKAAYEGGLQVTWGLTLNDPTAKKELQETGRTNWQTSLRIHNELINKKPDEIKTIIADIAKNYDSIDAQMRQILLSDKRLNGPPEHKTYIGIQQLTP